MYTHHSYVQCVHASMPLEANANHIAFVQALYHHLQATPTTTVCTYIYQPQYLE